jgi:hypothetical protein
MLTDVAKYFSSRKISHEIVLVNDGSKDATSEAGLRESKRLGLNLLVV